MKLQYFTDYCVIVETKSFCIFVPKQPHIDRKDGGHICISATRNGVYSLQDLSDAESFELSILQKITGQAMMEILNNVGIDIRLINYQINGNWTFFSPNRPLLHIHIYGRALSAKKQPFGESLYFPSKDVDFSYYEGNEPLSPSDCCGISRKIVEAITTKYTKTITIKAYYGEQ